MRLTRTAAIDHALSFAWAALLAVLAVGHVTGLRNTWSIVVVVATLLVVRRDAWRDLPARATLVALLAWCALSILWSTVPSLSFAKWRTDLVLPLLAYAAAFGVARRASSGAPYVQGVVVGLVVLALTSLANELPGDVVATVEGLVPFERFANVEGPMPFWYPGIGDASMFASFAAVALVVAPALPRPPRMRWIVVGWIAALVVVVVANNRAAVIALVATALVGTWFVRRCDGARRDRPTSVRRWAGVTLVVACVMVGTMLESGARERLRVLSIDVAPGSSAFVTLALRDTRPRIWRYYAELAERSPWIGVGFGRTVPGIHYRTEADRALAIIEPNAYIHAHNIVLDWWLQTGVIGVALLLTSWVLIARSVVRATRGSDSVPRKVAAVGAIALLAVLVIRGATDDFLVFGIATLFWSLLGAFAGLSIGARDERTER